MRRWVFLGVLLLGAPVVVFGGCGEECLPCTETSPCPMGGMAFDVLITGTTDSCDGHNLQLGYGTLIFGALEGNAVTITAVDSSGLRGDFQGGVCNSESGKTPPEYGYSGTMFVGSPMEDPQIFYTLAGTIFGSDPPTLFGSVTLSIIYADSPDNNCFLTGTMETPTYD